jgi:hypothetical protein
MSAVLFEYPVFWKLGFPLIYSFPEKSRNCPVPFPERGNQVIKIFLANALKSDKMLRNIF